MCAQWNTMAVWKIPKYLLKGIFVCSAAFSRVYMYIQFELWHIEKISNFLQPFLLLQEKHDIDVWCKQYFIIFDKFYVHFSSKGCSFFVLQLSKCKKSKSFKMVIHHSFTTLALAKSLFLLLLRRRQNIEMWYGISSCPKWKAEWL